MLRSRVLYFHAREIILIRLDKLNNADLIYINVVRFHIEFDLSRIYATHYVLRLCSLRNSERQLARRPTIFTWNPMLDIWNLIYNLTFHALTSLLVEITNVSLLSHILCSKISPIERRTSCSSI